MPNDLPTPAPTGARPIRIGSRRSALALKQTHMVRDALEALGHPTEVVTFSTVGDERLDVPLPAIGGRGSSLRSSRRRSWVAASTSACTR